MSSAVALKNPLTSSNRFSRFDMPFLPHQRLAERYELIKVLGSGGCSIVYLAIDHQVREHHISPYVAIKVLRPELHYAPEVLCAFQQEYSKAQRLIDPAVVKIHDFHQEEETAFLVMEALEGRTLGQLFRQYVGCGVPMTWSFLIIEQLLAAVRAIHRKQWIHYDLKPGNLLLSKQDNRLKILDVGLACEQKKNIQALPLEAITPAYASLEMLQGAPADQRDDIYSVACVIYELLSGKHPFDRLSASQACKANKIPEPIPGLTQRQWKVLKKALAFYREDRLPSIEAFQKGFLKPVNLMSYWRLLLGCGFLAEAFFQGWVLWVG